MSRKTSKGWQYERNSFRSNPACAFVGADRRDGMGDAMTIILHNGSRVNPRDWKIEGPLYDFRNDAWIGQPVMVRK
jgi:hypothetical protein